MQQDKCPHCGGDVLIATVLMDPKEITAIAPSWPRLETKAINPAHITSLTIELPEYSGTLVHNKDGSMIYTPPVEFYSDEWHCSEPDMSAYGWQVSNEPNQGSDPGDEQGGG